MSVELTLLIWSAALTVIQMLIAATGATFQVGLPKLAGNRDDVPACTGWAGRAQRAHRNMLENLVLFAILVLAVHLLNKSSPTTVLGAQLFFWGRVAYALVYLAGIPWLRTVVWFVSMVGLVMIFLKLI
ncbi:MAG: MAPEG family protein [Alphaproteobacteria bacterium]